MIVYVSNIAQIKFRPGQDEIGVNYASLHFQVSDGIDNSHAENIITFNVNGLLTDYDGNNYNTLVVGTQTWIAENLKSLHYFDGTVIDSVFAYDNNEDTVPTYGRLYTWDAAMYGSATEMVQGVCPVGWHLPSDLEWQTLADFLGGTSVAGGKLKEASLDYWILWFAGRV
jgi:hypothetical protein